MPFKNSFSGAPEEHTVGELQLEYLGHLISTRGITADPSKIDAMKQWPTP